MTVTLSPLAGAAWQFFDNNGVPLAGGLIYTYAAGTTTPLTTYTSTTGLVANTNPIVLDSAGRTPSEVWLTSGVSYKFIVKTSTGVQIGSYDNIGIDNIYSVFAASSGASLIGFEQGNSSGFYTGAVLRNVGLKLQETVSVLDFMNLSDVGTTNDVTYAFNAAINAAFTVYVPNGTYYVSNIALQPFTNIIGENTFKVSIVVNTTGTAAFYNANNYHIRISNLSIQSGPNVYNAIGYNQPDTTNYSAWIQFENIYTWVDLAISYNGFFIFTRWDNCQDGEGGSIPLGQYHQAIKSIPASYSQGNQTNMNQVINCQFNNGNDPTGTIYFGYAYVWEFKDCDFEISKTTAIHIYGCYGVTIDNCWFENIISTNVIIAEPNPSGQGASPISIQNCYYNGVGNNSYFLALGGASNASIINFNAATVSAGCKLTNVATLNELYGVFARTGAGMAGFLTGITATRENLIINTSTLNSPTITTPSVTNQNIKQGAINGTTPTVTPINVNGGGGGRTVLLFFNYANSTGNATASSIWMIRCGFDGNNYTATVIASDDGGAGAGRATPVFTVSAAGVLSIAAGYAGDASYGVISNSIG
jgi:hypothetical protein